MDTQSFAEGKKELQRLEEIWKQYALPFKSKFFENEVETIPLSIPIDQHPPMLVPDQYKEWFASNTVLPFLKQWKAQVIDVMEMRLQLKNGFTICEETASDTLDTLRHLCCHQVTKSTPSDKDAWDATAWFAAKLVVDNDRKGSPIQGMVKLGEVGWCYDVMLRLLIVVYCDLERTSNGYFEKLLGGPSVERLDPKVYKSDFYRIDNRPASKVDEMTGLHGYNRLHEDYPWFKAIGKGKK